MKCTFLTARAMRPADRPADHLTPDEVAAYLDGEAGSVERRSIEAHLATCEACLRDMVAVLRVVGRPPRGEP